MHSRGRSILLAHSGEQQGELPAVAGDLLLDFRALGHRHTDPVDGDILDSVMTVADRKPPIHGNRRALPGDDTAGYDDAVGGSPAATYDKIPVARLRQAPTVDIDEPLHEEIGKLLPLTRARDAPIGAEHKAGDAGQVEILPEQLSEVGGLSVYRQVGAVDPRQRRLTGRADERGRRILGRRWTRRPGQAGNHRDGDDKAPAVSGTAATRSSACALHRSHTPCCRALPIGPLLRPNEIALVTLE